MLTIDYDPTLLGYLDPATLGLWHWNGSGWSTDGIEIVGRDADGGLYDKQSRPRQPAEGQANAKALTALAQECSDFGRRRVV